MLVFGLGFDIVVKGRGVCGCVCVCVCVCVGEVDDVSNTSHLNLCAYARLLAQHGSASQKGSRSVSLVHGSLKPAACMPISFQSGQHPHIVVVPLPLASHTFLGFWG